MSKQTTLSAAGGAGASAAPEIVKIVKKKKTITSEPVLDMTTSVFTLTFGDAAENHVSMEIIGTKGKPGTGFTVDELREIASKTENAELRMLNSKEEHEEAAVLIIRNILNPELHKAMFEEQAKLDHDKKAFMYGRVVNKKARWNLCFDTVGHDPAYEEGKGCVVSMDEIPITKSFTDSFHSRFGDKAKDLKGEGNYYYDLKTCGIGWHGDSERTKVVALRLGGSIPICYRWYHKNKPTSEIMSIPLHGGDLYLFFQLQLEKQAMSF